MLFPSVSCANTGIMSFFARLAPGEYTLQVATR